MAANEPEREVEGWNGEDRRDGLAVRRGMSSWVIIPPDLSKAVTYCPCCGSIFRAARHAKLVANALFPEQKSTPDQGAAAPQR